MKIKNILNQKDISLSIKKYVLSDILKTDINYILLNQEKEISFLNQYKYNKLKNRILKGEPFQYVLKKANFYGLNYYINNNVLIPRPETERLVELTLSKLETKFKNKDLDVLDIGTGSGIIALTIKRLKPEYNVDATDISTKALKVAKKNANTQTLKINFSKADIINTNKKYNCIVSNPPYLDKESRTTEKSVKDYEPDIALFGGGKGLETYKKLFKKIKDNLKPEYLIAIEIGENQSKDLIKMINQDFNNPKIEVIKDYNNYERYLFIEK
jgi:release factor glutamine methyltransferase